MSITGDPGGSVGGARGPVGAPNPRAVSSFDPDDEDLTRGYLAQLDIDPTGASIAWLRVAQYTGKECANEMHGCTDPLHPVRVDVVPAPVPGRSASFEVAPDVEYLTVTVVDRQ